MPFASSGNVITDEAQILDGTIVNADVNASAGIEATKIQALDVGTNGGVLPSTGVANAHVASDAAIAYAKLAGGNQGEVLFVDSNGDLAVLSVGSNGQVLKSGGSGADVAWGASGTKLDLDVTGASIGNSATETTMYTFSVPGGTLGTASGVKGRVYFSEVKFTSSVALTFRLKYGTTTIASASATESHSGSAQGFLDFFVVANAATNAQKGAFQLIQNIPGDQTNMSFFYGNGTAAEDSTGALALTITAQWGSAIASSNCAAAFGYAESFA